MKEKIFFNKKDIDTLLKEMQENKYSKNTIFNFLNSHSIYLFVNHPQFREHVLRKNNVNFIDGFFLSVFLSISNLKIARRLKGPDFSDDFLNNLELSSKKKHFFIGVSNDDLKEILKKYPSLRKKNCFAYDLPLIKKERFDDKELVKVIKKINPNYVWVSIGNPKQEIISNDLAEKINVDYFFNVGAFFDYAKGKKKQSPKIFQNIGLEWMYRLFTDFKHSWIKVKRSFIANKYLFGNVGLNRII